MPEYNQFVRPKLDSSKWHHRYGIHLLWSVVLLLISATYNTALAASFVDRDHLASQVKQFVEGQLQRSPNSRYQVDVTGIDPRLRLHECAQPVVIENFTKGAIKRNVTVKVNCQDPKPWQLYVPVQVARQQKAVVVVHPVNAGQKIERTDIKEQFVDTQKVRRGYYASIDEVAGARVKRPLMAGQMISPSQLCLVCSGESVAIIAKGQGFSLKTVGEALGDGIGGQIITVKNRRSGRTIRAKVIDVGQVQVSF